MEEKMPSRAANLCQYRYKQTPPLSLIFKSPELDLNSGDEKKNNGGRVLGRGMNDTIPSVMANPIAE
ncbi:hypothetical protein OIU77_010215 [Salix suchowensis]|uniref:Uncharacterized protein n=2 Tax=Salix TaxID=40685 RepID=A0A9Q0P0X6_SALPP|nr:hypothetical protein OIU78_015818 [Salix suchowensis]KAJ6328478.1 hypothetical protein OIU77_010215 [Salix suchowensis]KAJ6679511.1 hypothetical protein OIU79_019300 [Salix purpurea]